MDDWRQIVVGLSQHTWRRHDASDNRQPEGSMSGQRPCWSFSINRERRIEPQRLGRAILACFIHERARTWARPAPAPPQRHVLGPEDDLLAKIRWERRSARAGSWVRGVERALPV